MNDGVEKNENSANPIIESNEIEGGLIQAPAVTEVPVATTIKRLSLWGKMTSYADPTAIVFLIIAILITGASVVVVLCQSKNGSSEIISKQEEKISQKENLVDDNTQDAIEDSNNNNNIIEAISGFKQISTGETSGCALTIDDKAYCWGSTIYDTPELGRANIRDSNVPIQIDMSGILKGKTIKYVAAGYSQGCAIASDNKGYCWGNNFYGFLGNNSTENSEVPVAIDTNGVLAGKDLVSISVDYMHSCAITTDGQAYCWGRNNPGGDDDLTPVAVYSLGVLNGKKLLSVSTGYNLSCGIASDGQAYCWSHISNGQIGNVKTSDDLVPIKFDGGDLLNGKTIQSITLGMVSNCLIASDKKAYCWGMGSDGELGDGLTTHYSSTPVAVDTTGALKSKEISDVTIGAYHACALTVPGEVYCWGDNDHGQLGNGLQSDQLSPIQVDVSGVMSGKKIISISADNDHTCALSSDGKAFCWGENDDGELGNGTNIDSYVPVLVSGVDN